MIGRSTLSKNSRLIKSTLKRKNTIEFQGALSDKQEKLFDFIKSEHSIQTRKNGTPYIEHLIFVGEACEMVANQSGIAKYGRELGWSHDLYEDQLHQFEDDHGRKAEYFKKLLVGFGYSVDEAVEISDGVRMLTDHFPPKFGMNRRQRKTLENARMARMHPAVQTVKYWDIFDNMYNIEELEDGEFALKYTHEKARTLMSLRQGDPQSRAIAWEVVYVAFSFLYGEGDPLGDSPVKPLFAQDK